MGHQPLALGPNYRAYVRGLRDLHRLAVAGQEESPEAERIRDAMDAPWEALSDVERTRAGGLSADLYSLSEPLTGPEQEWGSQAQAGLAAVLTAQDKGDWDEALELLRRHAHSLAPDLVHFLRGRT